MLTERDVRPRAQGSAMEQPRGWAGTWPRHSVSSDRESPPECRRRGPPSLRSSARIPEPRFSQPPASPPRALQEPASGDAAPGCGRRGAATRDPAGWAQAAPQKAADAPATSAGLALRTGGAEAQRGIIKKSTNNKCWRGAGETVGGNAKWYSHYGEQCGNYLKNWR